MKMQLSKPGRERASYTEHYKQEAMGVWRASGRSAANVAAELGIQPPLLYRWARVERIGAEEAKTSASQTAAGKPWKGRTALIRRQCRVPRAA